MPVVSTVAPLGPFEATKDNGPQSIGRSRGDRTTRIHMVRIPMVAADARTAISLLPGQAHDAPGRKNRLGQQHDSPSLIIGQQHDSPSLIMTARTKATRPANWHWH